LDGHASILSSRFRWARRVLAQKASLCVPQPDNPICGATIQFAPKNGRAGADPNDRAGLGWYCC